MRIIEPKFGKVLEKLERKDMSLEVSLRHLPCNHKIVSTLLMINFYFFFNDSLDVRIFV